MEEAALEKAYVGGGKLANREYRTECYSSLAGPGREHMEHHDERAQQCFRRGERANVARCVFVS